MWLAPAAAAAVLAIGVPQVAVAETVSTSESVPAATVSVDFGAVEGDRLRTEGYNTWDNDHPEPELRDDDVAFLTEQGLRADLLRIGFRITPDMCDLDAQTCDFSSVDWIDSPSALTDSLVVHLSPVGMFDADREPADFLPLLTLAIRELKEERPNVDYIEFYNEPDWLHHVQQLLSGREPRVQPEDLYDWYVPYYQAVNAANAELEADDRIMVGGPTLASFDQEGFIPGFLDGYAADTDPDKRLDFVSWHAYGYFDKNNSYRFVQYKEDLSQLATQRPRLDAMLADRGITEEVPALVTETGIYPGGLADEPEPSKNDWLRQAAGLASMHYWYAEQPLTYPFHWTVRHGTNGRKDQLVTLRGEGETSPADTFTPYGNLLVMQSMMKDTRVSATSDRLVNGQGVYAMAAKDASGASVMVWNYKTLRGGETAFEATVDMTNIPADLRDGAVRQQVFLIDSETSNYWANPGTADLQMVDQQLIDLATSHSTVLNLDPNALYLVVLEPATPADCRRGGWSDFGFTNQGHCVRFIRTGTDSRD